MGPNLTYGGTAVFVRSNIQHALVDIPMLKSLQTSAISAEMNDLETVIGAVYESPITNLEE